ARGRPKAALRPGWRRARPRTRRQRHPGRSRPGRSPHRPRPGRRRRPRGRPGRLADTGPQSDPRVPVVARLLGFHVVLADDAGHRALRAWLARDPDGTPLPALLDRRGDDIWMTQGIPEELAARLMSAAGSSVT